jgi:PIN domain nuclease of toxin-antitoxin system
MAETVLDSSALLAAILLEPGHQAVQTGGAVAVMSTVNLAEVYARAEERGAGEDKVDAILELMAIEIHPFEQRDARQAAALKPPTRHLGLSLGDRACLALAQRLGLPVLTADRRWAKLDIGVEVRLIR